jgi:cytochrome o ubiquinol oxidase subunit I
MVTCAAVGGVLVATLTLVTIKGWWPYLWREWLTSVDHKRIGVMYMILGLVMLVRGFSDAILMRTQLALAAGRSPGYLPPEHYGDAVRRWAHEFCGAAATRRPRRRVSGP